MVPVVEQGTTNAVGTLISHQADSEILSNLLTLLSHFLRSFINTTRGFPHHPPRLSSNAVPSTSRIAKSVFAIKISMSANNRFSHQFHSTSNSSFCTIKCLTMTKQILFALLLSINSSPENYEENIFAENKKESIAERK